MEISLAELRRNCPPGWLPVLQLVWEILEEWRPIAAVTSEPRPRIVRWTRDQCDAAGIVSNPWLEFDGFGRSDEFEFETLEQLSRAVGRLVCTCEACGAGRSRKHFAPRAGGGVRYLCDACHPLQCADLSKPLRNNVGAPYQAIEPTEGWGTGRDDLAWSPGKDEEDDARDGLLDSGDDLPL